MKRFLITMLVLSSFISYAQHTKKKVYRKPVKKNYTQKKASVKPAEEVKPEVIEKTPEVVNPTPVPEVVEAPKAEVVQEKADYEKTAEKILQHKGWINNRNSFLVRGVEGFVKGVYSANGKIFVMIEVSNRSNINYDIQNVSFITSPAKKKSKAIDTEEKLFIPIWSNQPETISKKSTSKIVFVFDKFTIAENKTLNAVINENDGERNLTLEVKPQYILGAEYIK